MRDSHSSLHTCCAHYEKFSLPLLKKRSRGDNKVDSKGARNSGRKCSAALDLLDLLEMLECCRHSVHQSSSINKTPCLVGLTILLNNKTQKGTFWYNVMCCKFFHSVNSNEQVRTTKRLPIHVLHTVSCRIHTFSRIICEKQFMENIFKQALALFSVITSFYHLMTSHTVKS